MFWDLTAKIFTGIQGKIIFGMALSGWCIVMFWLFWPYCPIKIHDVDIINSGGIHPGGSLVYEVNYTKSKVYPVVCVTRRVTNDAVIVLAPGKPSTLPIGDHKVKVIAKLPEYVGLGTHVFSVTAQYRVNHIRIISVTAKSKPFEITKKVIE